MLKHRIAAVLFILIAGIGYPLPVVSKDAHSVKNFVNSLGFMPLSQSNR